MENSSFIRQIGIILSDFRYKRGIDSNFQQMYPQEVASFMKLMMNQVDQSKKSKRLTMLDFADK